MAPALERRLEAMIGRRPVERKALHGGCIAEVACLVLDDGSRVVVKEPRGDAPSLEIEAGMLRDLRERTRLPVPEVVAAAPDLLVLEHIEHDGTGAVGREAQRHAADLLADLHGLTAERCGYERDTLIGPLTQPNPWADSWITFFIEQRLLRLATLGLEAGTVDRRTVRRLESLAAKLDGLLIEPLRPSLLHGDVWQGNILSRKDRIAAFVDPAISYGHPEIELAFGTLFGTLEDAFFERYEEQRPLEPGFFEVRKDIYNLYPLLVHAHLFGGGYLGGVVRTLERHGC